MTAIVAGTYVFIDGIRTSRAKGKPLEPDRKKLMRLNDAVQSAVKANVIHSMEQPGILFIPTRDVDTVRTALDVYIPQGWTYGAQHIDPASDPASMRLGELRVQEAIRAEKAKLQSLYDLLAERERAVEKAEKDIEDGLETLLRLESEVSRDPNQEKIEQLQAQIAGLAGMSQKTTADLIAAQKHAEVEYGRGFDEGQDEATSRYEVRISALEAQLQQAESAPRELPTVKGDVLPVLNGILGDETDVIEFALELVHRVYGGALDPELEKAWYTPKEVADIVGIKPGTVGWHVKQGNLWKDKDGQIPVEAVVSYVLRKGVIADIKERRGLQ